MLRELAALSALAGGQVGVFTVGQAAAHGIDRRRLRRARAAGVIEQVHQDVYRFTATSRSARQAIRAATFLTPEAVAGFESALHLHGVDRLPLTTPVIIVAPRGTATFSGVRVHRFADLRAEHVTEIEGVPTSTVPRAVVDLVSVFSHSRMVDLLDRLTITSRVTTTAAIGRVLHQIGRRGRRDIAWLTEELDRRRPLGPPLRSTLERRADELLLGSDLPAPLREHPLPSVFPDEGLVDRAWELARLILEIDGRSWHAREASMARDRARDRAAARVGWQTLRVLDEELDDHPEIVIDDIAATYRERRLTLGGGPRPPTPTS